MPTESLPPSAPPAQTALFHPNQLNAIKCSLCGAGGFSSAPSRSNEGVVTLSDPAERICRRCVRTQENRREERDGIGLGLSFMGRGDDREREREREREERLEEPPRGNLLPSIYDQTLDIHSTTPTSPSRSFAQSLPNQHTRPWKTAPTLPAPIPEVQERTPSPPVPAQVQSEQPERPPNPLLDVTKARIPSIGRGALYAGSVFRGTQTSGRSAYEVEVRFLVSLAFVSSRTGSR